MPDEFSLNLDLSEIRQFYHELNRDLDRRLKAAAHSLAMQAHAHVKEQAAQKLHTRLEMFNEHLDFEQLDKSTWAIIVRQPARWIEDGMEPHSMLDDLLSSPKAKNKKGGGKYIVIPFKHNKGPTQTGSKQKAMLSELKKTLKSQGIKYGAIEKNTDGSPKTGLLHKFDLNKPTQNRPKPGHEGPVGTPFAAHSPAGGHEGPSGRPYLQGVRIYQHLKKNPDGSPKLNKKGEQMASREIVTFRVASSSQQGTGAWFHPGLAPAHLLEDAYNWAKDQWDNHIAPEILRDLGV